VADAKTKIFHRMFREPSHSVLKYRCNWIYIFCVYKIIVTSVIVYFQSRNQCSKYRCVDGYWDPHFPGQSLILKLVWFISDNPEVLSLSSFTGSHCHFPASFKMDYIRRATTCVMI
jgi:hypothetical protein